MTIKAGDDRRRAMLEHIRRFGRVEVMELTERLLISPETVRRDRPPTHYRHAFLGVAKTLAAAEELSVIQLGGRVRSQIMATVDHWAIDMLSDMSGSRCGDWSWESRPNSGSGASAASLTSPTANGSSPTTGSPPMNRGATATWGQRWSACNTGSRLHSP